MSLNPTKVSIFNQSIIISNSGEAQTNNGSAGQIRFNQTKKKFEGYHSAAGADIFGNAWRPLTQDVASTSNLGVFRVGDNLIIDQSTGILSSFASGSGRIKQLVITVSPILEAADYTSINAAISNAIGTPAGGYINGSITSNIGSPPSPTYPFIIQLAPGQYNEAINQIVLPDYVSIIGADNYNSVITQNIGNVDVYTGSMVVVGQNCEIQNLVINLANTNNSNVSNAIYSLNKSNISIDSCIFTCNTNITTIINTYYIYMNGGNTNTISNCQFLTNSSTLAGNFTAINIINSTPRIINNKIDTLTPNATTTVGINIGNNLTKWNETESIMDKTYIENLTLSNNYNNTIIDSANNTGICLNNSPVILKNSEIEVSNISTLTHNYGIQIVSLLPLIHTTSSNIINFINDTSITSNSTSTSTSIINSTNSSIVNFFTLGFQHGQYISISGSSYNDGIYRISSVTSATEIILDASFQVITEDASISNTITIKALYLVDIYNSKINSSSEAIINNDNNNNYLFNINNLNTIGNTIITPSYTFYTNYKTLTVGKVNCNFTSLQYALNSITDNNSNTRYLVKIESGIYEEHNYITCKPYVNIEGNGEDNTTLLFYQSGNTSNIPSSNTSCFLLCSNIKLSGFTINNSNIDSNSNYVYGQTTSTVLYNPSPITNTIIENIVINSICNSYYNTGLYLNSAANNIIIRNVYINVYSNMISNMNICIFNKLCSNISYYNVSCTVNSPLSSNNYAISVFDSDFNMYDSTLYSDSAIVENIGIQTNTSVLNQKLIQIYNGQIRVQNGIDYSIYADNYYTIVCNNIQILGDTYTNTIASHIFCCGCYSFNNATDKLNIQSLNSRGQNDQSQYDTITIGDSAGKLNASGTENVIIGVNAGSNVTNASYSTIIGANAGSQITTANNNVLLGSNAGNKITTGSYNTITGSNSGSNAGSNTGITTGNNNIITGSNVGNAITTGNNNTLIGTETAKVLETGNLNVFLGTSTGVNTTTSNNNILIGASSGSTNQSGNDNTYIGFQSGNASILANDNIMIGKQAGYNNLSNGIVAIGNYACYSNSNSSSYSISNNIKNTYLGFQSGYNTTAGDGNTFLGNNTGYSSSNSSATFNTTIGNEAGYSLTTGSRNVLMGATTSSNGTSNDSAGWSLTSGNDNVHIGVSSGNNATSAINNVLIGSAVGTTIKTASNNVLIGKNTGNSLNNSGQSVIIGTNAGNVYSAGNGIIVGYNAGTGYTGEQAFALGYQSGSNIIGNFNMFMGYNSGGLQKINTSGAYNIAIGPYTAYNMSAGTRNIIVGSGNSSGSAGKLISTGSDNTLVGFKAGSALQTGGGNTLISSNAGPNLTSGIDNLVLGYQSAFNLNSGSYNIVLGNETGYNLNNGNGNIYSGYQSGYKNATGSYNINMGYQSGYSSTGNNYNIHLGHQSGYKSKADTNLFLGYQSGLNNTFGTNNIFIGSNSGAGINTNSEQIGYNNIFLGVQSGYSNDNGYSNIFMGSNSGENNINGSKNIFIGENAGSISSTSNNIFIGNASSNSAGIGYLSTGIGQNNVFIGSDVGIANTTGNENIFLGYQAGMDNVDGDENIYIGTNAGQNANSTLANNNIAIGSNAGINNHSGMENILIGKQVAGLTTSTNYNKNIIIGATAGQNIQQDNQIFIGTNAGQLNTTGDRNIFIGLNAGQSNINSPDNVVIGSNAGISLIGSGGIGDNVLIGSQAGQDLTTGTNNIYIGSGAGTNAITSNNNVVIGANAMNQGNADNVIIIGHNSGLVNEANNNIFIGSNTGISNVNSPNNILIGNNICKSLSGYIDYVLFNTPGISQTWTVPNGITKVMFVVIGGFGNMSFYYAPIGGYGANVKAIVDVVPNTTYTISVGGNSYSVNTGFQSGNNYGGISANGYEGSNGGFFTTNSTSTGGGAASNIYYGTTPYDGSHAFDLLNVVVVAGGGGGNTHITTSGPIYDINGGMGGINSNGDGGSGLAGQYASPGAGGLGGPTSVRYSTVTYGTDPSYPNDPKNFACGGGGGGISGGYKGTGNNSVNGYPANNGINGYPGGSGGAGGSYVNPSYSSTHSYSTDSTGVPGVYIYTVSNSLITSFTTEGSSNIWIVPNGISQIKVIVIGGTGGTIQGITSGGYGSNVSATLNVTQYTDYTICVGGNAYTLNNINYGGISANGYQGSNGGYINNIYTYVISSGGGAASTIYFGSDIVVVAGGGGGYVFANYIGIYTVNFYFISINGGNGGTNINGDGGIGLDMTVYEKTTNINYGAGGSGGQNTILYITHGIDPTYFMDPNNQLCGGGGGGSNGGYKATGYKGTLGFPGGSGGAGGSYVNPAYSNTYSYSTDTTGKPGVYIYSLNGLIITVAGGTGYNALGYSVDGGINWIPSNNGNSLFIQCQAIACNGSIWLAGGISTIYTNMIAYSTDGGINWYPTTNYSNIFSYCNAIAWNGTMWVAGGNRGGYNTLAYSSDGMNWTPSINGNSIISSQCNAIAWNGSIWVAGGIGTNTLAYSTDGINWTPSINGNSIISTCYAIAWNDYIWVAGGTGTLAYSTDGINWTPSNNGSSIISRCNGIAWNGSIWVACGGSGAFSLGYSSDGINWTGSTNGNDFCNGCISVVWNGIYFVATSASDSGTEIIIYSSDGMYWYPSANGNSIMYPECYAIASYGYIAFAKQGSLNTFTVPNGITQIIVNVVGGSGGMLSGNYLSYGANVSATINVTPNTEYTISVGGNPYSIYDPVLQVYRFFGGISANGYEGSDGGFFTSTNSNSSGGGAASTIYFGSNAVVVAGGAGGYCNYQNSTILSGGNGGININGDGASGLVFINSSYGIAGTGGLGGPSTTIGSVSISGIDTTYSTDPNNFACGGGGGGSNGGYKGTGNNGLIGQSGGSGGAGGSYVNPSYSSTYSYSTDTTGTPGVYIYTVSNSLINSFTTQGSLNTCTIPIGITEIKCIVIGGSGGTLPDITSGGYGANVSAILNVIPNTDYTICVGGNSYNYYDSNLAVTFNYGGVSANGYEGSNGGYINPLYPNSNSSGGGAASTIYYGSNVVIVSGGGGGYVNSGNININNINGGNGGINSNGDGGAGLDINYYTIPIQTGIHGVGGLGGPRTIVPGSGQTNGVDLTGMLDINNMFCGGGGGGSNGGYKATDSGYAGGSGGAGGSYVNPVFSNNYSYSSDNTGVPLVYIYYIEGDNAIYKGENIVIGNNVGTNLSLCDNNIIIGSNTGVSIVSGSKNVLVGSNVVINGNTNNTVVIGNNAGNNNSIDNVVFIGTNAGKLNQSFDNIAIGYNAGTNNISGGYVGGYNICIGNYAGFKNLSGFNIYIGSNSGANMNSDGNVCIGAYTLENLTNGAGGGGNLCIGNYAGQKMFNFASVNLCVGFNSCKNITTGVKNTCVGSNTLFNGITASGNTCVGYESGFNTNSDYNIFIGYNSGYTNINGSGNCYLGYYSGFFNTGSSNSYFGNRCGQSNIGSNNAFIGYELADDHTPGNNIPSNPSYYNNTFGIYNNTVSGITSNITVGSLTVLLGGKFNTGTIGVGTITPDNYIGTPITQTATNLVVLGKVLANAYTTFTGAHNVIIDLDSSANINSNNLVEGMIMSSTGVVVYSDINNTVVNVKPSNVVNDKTVYGVYCGSEIVLNDDQTEILSRTYYVNSLGEGGILVTNYGGNIGNKDYITTCPISGYGALQSDDKKHSYTVAKCTQNINWDSITTTINYNGIDYKYTMATCTYHCG